MHRAGLCRWVDKTMGRRTPLLATLMGCVDIEGIKDIVVTSERDNHI